jgi:hypothetical protein
MELHLRTRLNRLFCLGLFAALGCQSARPAINRV